MATEIERKWVADAVPPAEMLGEPAHLRQGYVALDASVSVRVRIAGSEAWLTVKAGGDGHNLSRTEVEVAIAPDDAEALWAYTSGRRLEKRRYRVPVDDGLVAEVDVFSGDLAGLCVVEVEFGSETAAREFVAPDWFGREVTGRTEWSNASLAEHGRPTV